MVLQLSAFAHSEGKLRMTSGVEMKIRECYSTPRHGVRHVVDRSLLASGWSSGYRRARGRPGYREPGGLAEEI